MRESWTTDEILGIKLSPCGNFSAKRINAANKDQMWELTNHITNEVTYHPTFTRCKSIVAELRAKREK